MRGNNNKNTIQGDRRWRVTLQVFEDYWWQETKYWNGDAQIRNTAEEDIRIKLMVTFSRLTVKWEIVVKLYLNSWNRRAKEESLSENLLWKYLQKTDLLFDGGESHWSRDSRPRSIILQILLWLFSGISKYISEAEDKMRQHYSMD